MVATRGPGWRLAPCLAGMAHEADRIAPDRPEIALATLGGNAGLIGAAALAQVELGTRG